MKVRPFFKKVFFFFFLSHLALYHVTKVPAASLLCPQESCWMDREDSSHPIL